MTESSGKIYTYVSPDNYRLNKSLIVCKLSGLNIETTPGFTIKESVDADFLKKFPLGKVPSFEHGSFRLFDSSAIMLYLASKAPNSSLLGKTPEESASILQYMFMVESDIMPASANIIYPTLGFSPYVKPAIQTAEAKLNRALVALNNILVDKTYLVGERMTIADINTVCDLVPIMSQLLDKKYRMDIRNVTRYFKTMINKKVFKETFTQFKFCEEPIKPQQKPKDAKPAKAKTEEPKVQPKKKAKEVTNEDEDDEPAPAPKPKSALDLLPKSSFDLENWKRFYSNNDTKPTAMDYFWQNFDPVGYSIWKVQFKYNEENTLIFMSNNLIGGFFNRLDRARKYAFGVMLTLGVDNDNIISGYFVVRGQEIPFEISDAPDYESFSWVKVDQNDPAVREEIGDYFAWEGPSLPKPFADGKAFK
ncbi:Elongation factor 1-gamma [Smittium mucronatum]|uniref:Elongation factor 1-gamma n=1 Tax=Smittium mucronatum TaxID=133383 RepID=A0A1R0H803_9FUNG|nr:Elongation factor 1-gamma [Smittium mucronatum]